MRWFITLILTGLILTGCASSSPPGATQTPPPPTAPPGAGNTATIPTTPPQSYQPPSAPTSAVLSAWGYPPPPDTGVQGPAFTINIPLRAVDAQVSGTGPAGVPIQVLNITAGSLIAEVQISPEGMFVVDATGFLNPGDKVALVLGNLNNAQTQFTSSDFANGPGYQLLPSNVVAFAIAQVE